jgi:hypothetical protein
MNESLSAVLMTGVSVGVFATITMDIWLLFAKHVLRLPTADWAMAGRWFGHMAHGAFIHESIHAAEPIAHERIVGWIGHYVTGIVYGIAYIAIVRLALDTDPTFVSALTFGVVTLVVPWLVMQPAMGAGAFASRTPQPGRIRIVNVSVHVLFGVALYGGWLLLP